MHSEVLILNEYISLNTEQPFPLLKEFFPAEEHQQQNEVYLDHEHRVQDLNSDKRHQYEIDSSSMNAKQWIRMIESRSPLEKGLDIVPVEEKHCFVIQSALSYPTPLQPNCAHFNNDYLLEQPSVMCLVKQSVLKHSTLGSVNLYRVGRYIGNKPTRFMNDIEYVELLEPAQLVVIKTFENEKAALSSENPMTELGIHQRLSKLQNNHIMPLMACLGSRKRLYAVYPYYAEGDLFHSVSRGDDKLHEDEIRNMMHAMVSSLDTCHQAGVCHRDISLENFLVNESSLVLIDFGLSVEMNSADGFAIENRPVGKVKYMAPELVLGKSAAVDGRKVDIWSLGVTLFMCLTKTEPWHVASNLDDRFRIMISKGNMKAVFQSWGIFVSPSLMELMQLMLSLDPATRPTTREILEHRWMSAA